MKIYFDADYRDQFPVGTQGAAADYTGKEWIVETLVRQWRSFAGEWSADDRSLSDVYNFAEWPLDPGLGAAT
ncbi:MAG: hypothetical protein HY895_06985 [Deltaproteobacteria bacterium]|nr:hypothetical protein [Deltaproteobacteria bacterium]